jgi:hypothetical protein
VTQHYGEGDWFTVPIGKLGHAVGLVARKPRRGTLFLGYFFGPARRTVPVQEELDRLAATDAVFVCRLRDNALHRGLWRVVGKKERWRHKDWPMPRFLRREGLSGKTIRIEYDADNLTTPARETEANAADLTLPEDIVYDEKRLVAALGQLFASEKPVTLDPGHWTR